MAVARLLLRLRRWMNDCELVRRWRCGGLGGAVAD